MKNTRKRITERVYERFPSIYLFIIYIQTWQQIQRLTQFTYTLRRTFSWVSNTRDTNVSISKKMFLVSIYEHRQRRCALHTRPK